MSDGGFVTVRCGNVFEDCDEAFNSVSSALEQGSFVLGEEKNMFDCFLLPGRGRETPDLQMVSGGLILSQPAELLLPLGRARQRAPL